MKPRILVVDDDETIAQQLFWTLSDDYEVVTANDMRTAVRRATIYEPDVSILDLQLPPHSDSPETGLRLLEFIKGRFPDSKVVVMTASGSARTRQACYAAGADDFLAKPFETEHLLTKLRRMVPCSLELA